MRRFELASPGVINQAKKDFNRLIYLAKSEQLNKNFKLSLSYQNKASGIKKRIFNEYGIIL